MVTNISPHSNAIPDSSGFTTAPLQLEGRFHFAADADRVFDRVTHDDGIASILPMVRSVTHEGPEDEGACSVGAVRTCDFGPAMGKVHETIVWWSPPQGYAFRAEATMMPIRDHLAYFLLEEAPSGGVRLTVRHYFRRKRLPHALFVRALMARLISKAMNTLALDLGGTGGQMKVSGRSVRIPDTAAFAQAGGSNA